jgi:hypothetical protein
VVTLEFYEISNRVKKATGRGHRIQCFPEMYIARWAAGDPGLR